MSNHENTPQPPANDIKRLKAQLKKSREDIISLMPENIQRILQSYHLCRSEEAKKSWYEDTVHKLATSPTPEFEAILDSHSGYAPCPLCGATSSSPYQWGFTLPEGLRRHLIGAGMAKECVVMAAVKALADEYFLDEK